MKTDFVVDVDTVDVVGLVVDMVLEFFSNNVVDSDTPVVFGLVVLVAKDEKSDFDVTVDVKLILSISGSAISGSRFLLLISGFTISGTTTIDSRVVSWVSIVSVVKGASVVLYKYIVVVLLKLAVDFDVDVGTVVSS